MKHALVNCSNKYVIVIAKIQAAETSFSQGNVTAAKARLTEATVNRQLCDKGFEGKRYKSPISDWTTKLSQMQNNAESIINHIQPWFHVDMNKISNNQVGAHLYPCCPIKLVLI